jgi:hypothetical protein
MSRDAIDAKQLWDYQKMANAAKKTRPRMICNVEAEHLLILVDAYMERAAMIVSHRCHVDAARAAERENAKALRDHALIAQAESHADAMNELRARLEKFAAFADEKGEPRSHCINCGTWWDRKERCPLCMGTHAEMAAAKQAAEDAAGGKK